MIRTGRHLGRCKSCKRTHRVDGGGWVPSARCSCGASVRLQEVLAYEVPEVRCGGSCRNAVGPACDCSCAGANHGINH